MNAMGAYGLPSPPQKKHILTIAPFVLIVGLSVSEPLLHINNNKKLITLYGICTIIRMRFCPSAIFLIISIFYTFQ